MMRRRQNPRVIAIAALLLGLTGAGILAAAAPTRGVVGRRA